MTRRLRLATLLTLGGALIATQASLASAATTGHSQTIEVRCTETGFVADANAFAGQRREVTAFYNATGTACKIYDGETNELLYDPSAP
jgi:ABC-type Fe2+-enterobactin transport system substrate-binding protein